MKQENPQTLEFEKLLTKAIIKYTNQYRKLRRVPALVEVEDYSKAGKLHCEYLAYETDKSNMYTLGHGETNTSNPFYTGSSPSDRVSKQLNEKAYCGENVLYVFDIGIKLTSENLCHFADTVAYKMVFVQWYNSMGHRKNMLDKKYKYLGAAGTIYSEYYNDAFDDCRGDKITYDEKKPYMLIYGVQVFWITRRFRRRIGCERKRAERKYKSI